MTSRVIETRADLDIFMRLAQSRKMPYTLTLESGKKRTAEQNRLQPPHDDQDYGPNRPTLIYSAPLSAQSLIDAAREECAKVIGFWTGERNGFLVNKIRALKGKPLNT